MKIKLLILLLSVLLSLTSCWDQSRAGGRGRSSDRISNNNDRNKRSREKTPKIEDVPPTEIPEDEPINEPTPEPVPDTPSRTKLDGAEIFAKYESAVFMVYTYDNNYQHQGSGFFINNQGLAVSNYHVFNGTHANEQYIKLSENDKPYRVTKIIKDTRGKDYDTADFIIFQTECNKTNYIPLATEQPKVGEKVYAIGSPLGLENTFSSGEVSQWRGDDHTYMQISVPTDHGSSGGALINEYGEVVGITSAGVDESNANLNFAWSIDVIKPYLP